MVDSGSSMSIVRKEVFDRPFHSLWFITASGEPLLILDYIMAPIKIGQQNV